MDVNNMTVPFRLKSVGPRRQSLARTCVFSLRGEVENK